MVLNRETDMSLMSEDMAGQGSIPPVPAFNIPCEKCKAEVSLVDGQIPVTCPHCGYHLRPRSDSMWNHFLFVLRHRYLVWRGRSTRKEFWSFNLFSYIIWLLFLIGICMVIDSTVPECSCPVGHLGAFVVALCCALVVYIPLIAIPQTFLIARRLHDIGISGITVIIQLVLVALVCGAFISIFSIKAVEEYPTHSSIVTVDNEENSDELIHIDDDELVHSLDLSDENELAITIFITLASISMMGVDGLRLFFLVIGFLNSNRGTNKFGPSRKYPIRA